MQNTDSVAQPANEPRLVKSITPGTFITVFAIIGFFMLFGAKMGVENMFSTMMKTAADLLLNTVFFIMAVAVLAGAFSSLMAEFGVIALINRILSPLMGPLYRLPGAAALGVVTTYLSDNPAIVALAKDPDFIKYFTLRQRALLTNIGTSFGMGLIVATVMLAQSKSPAMMSAVGIGTAAACIGSIISVKLMDFFAKRHYGAAGDKLIQVDYEGGTPYDIMKFRKIREGNAAQRVLSSLLDGGKNGIDIGFAITPGVLIICTFVMMLVFGPAGETYTGKAYEGIALLPQLVAKIDFILTPLFGFTTPEAVAFPCTAVGAVGAALGMVGEFLEKGLIGANDIAVFTAMGMIYSGYLSTHVSMLDALGARELTGKAIFSHTIAGLCAGIVAHWMFVFIVGV